ncbi:MAG TPA: hypothetical protein VGI40_20155 [Pirellulaceae bacterium]
MLTAMLLLSTGRIAIAEDIVLNWFRFDSERPYAIFDAWKELSTRKAAICVGENWKVIAGQLQNNHGKPIANTALRFDLVSGKAVHADLQTDANGYFIIYSPWYLDIDDDEPSNGRRVIATPGYPVTQAGQYFAYKCSAIRMCKSKLVTKENDRAFYVLTCDDQTAFDADKFKAFEQEYLAKRITPRDPWRATPDDREKILNRRFYEVQLVDPMGNGVADALITCRFPGTKTQVRKTGMDGRCQFDDWQLPGKNGDLTIDAPGFAAGPMPFELKFGVLNVIRLQRPATVVGRIVDDEGNPETRELHVEYKRFSYIAFETDFRSQSDGTFSFDRVMPNEEFRIQSGNARSEWMKLTENEKSKEVQLKLEMPSALRGIVVSEKGDLMPVGLRLDFGPDESLIGVNGHVSYVGTNNGPWGPSDGRFGFSGLSNRPFRIKVYGWEVEPSEPMQLEPGEMRFIQVKLKKKLSLPQ